MRIAIMESDPDLSVLLTEFMIDMGFSVLLGNNYKTSKLILASHNPDIVILSKHLKGGSVKELAHDAMGRKIKTIIISTDKEPQVICTEFLREPFDLWLLEKMITSKEKH